MNVLIFGATGMVGHGVLRECLLDPGVDRVLVVGRHATGVRDPKVRDVVHGDLWNFAAIESELTGFDACFFCLGVSALGMKEADYERVTYGITMAAAGTLARLNPQMTFIYVSGAGTDSSERGRMMWARVKGRTENAIFRLPFKAAFAFRPGAIQPVHGVQSRTAWYRVMYSVTGPLLPVFRRLMPGAILTTEEVGRAMLIVARHGAPKPVLEARDIDAIARRG
jgi:uncharacterized protein YbjT (DUF2867 family)